MHVLHRLATTAAALALVAASAAAQTGRPTIGVFGGAAFPTGDYADGLKSGYSLGLDVGYRPASLPFGLRGDAAFSQFDFKGSNVGSKAHTRVASFTANGVFGTPAQPGSVRPYLIGGGGLYNFKSGNASENKFGVNGGLGLDMPLSGIGVFLEARYNYVFTKDSNVRGSFNASYVPVVVGVRF